MHFKELFSNLNFQHYRYEWYFKIVTMFFRFIAFQALAKGRMKFGNWLSIEIEVFYLFIQDRISYSSGCPYSLCVCVCVLYIIYFIWVCILIFI